MMQNTGKLAGLTIYMTGGSRGIGKAIALKAAQDGANIVIAAKTTTPHPKLPGTIYSVADEIEKAGGKCLPCCVDVRNEEDVSKSVSMAVSHFKSIDILINNASAIDLRDILSLPAKKYDLMQEINVRGTYITSKSCVPHLLKSKSLPHILSFSPPISLQPSWFKKNLAYTLSKYGMSMCSLGLAAQFKDKIAVNALWPKYAVFTAATEFIGDAMGLASEEMRKRCRRVEVMSDAAYTILTQSDKSFTANFCIDEDILRSFHAITDFSSYLHEGTKSEEELIKDFFLD